MVDSELQTQRPFAVFDIDGTLIRWQLFHAVVHHLGKYGYIPQATHNEIVAARMDWKKRTTNKGFLLYEQVLFQAYIAALGAIRTDDYDKIVQEVFEEYKDQTFVYTRDLVKDLKKQGYLLFAISGSQHEVVSKLAKYHGFDDAVGAQLERKDGAFTGAIASPIFSKKEALEHLIDEHGAGRENSIGVGDSENDIDMLNMVGRPIAFNPDNGLYKKAVKQGWEIILERKNMIYKLEPQRGTYILG